jgi:hypothetical protein
MIAPRARVSSEALGNQVGAGKGGIKDGEI